MKVNGNNFVISDKIKGKNYQIDKKIMQTRDDLKK